jgi:hypothetical protein
MHQSSIGTSVAGVARLPSGETIGITEISGAGAYDVVSVGESGAVVLGSFTGSGRPIFASTESMLVWSDGRAINRVMLDGLDTGPLEGPPPIATHVVAQSLRLLANEANFNRTHVNYSGVASGNSVIGHQEWNVGIGASGSTSGFFSSEANPDPILALVANSNEIVAFKTGLTQSFVPDATTVYAKVTTVEFGCAAPYSVISDDQSFAWMDDRRRIVHSDLREVTPLSDPIQSTLDDMETVADCIGMRIHHGPVDALVWVFPTDGRTFAYQKSGGWSQWMGWDMTTNRWSRWIVNAHAHVPGDHANLVGLTDGRIGILAHDTPDDIGEPIPAYIQTGYINRQSDLRKRCLGVRLTFRRGKAAGAATPIAGLSWRDDEGSWQGPIDISMGRSADTAPVVSLRGLGIYRRRQWRLSFFGPEEFVLAGAEEEYETLSQ